MKRLNVKLALWLAGSVIFLFVGVHLLHGFQVDRNADDLRKLAVAAEKDGRIQEAIDNYSQYLKYRDDPEGYSALAALAMTAAEEVDASRKVRFQAYSVLQQAIIKHPELDDVRRLLLDYSFKIGQYPETLEHIQYLERGGATEPAWDLKAAQCYLLQGDEEKGLKRLRQMVGINDETLQFNDEPGPGAAEVGAYTLLAQLYLRNNDRTRANGVMDKMVERNPDSAQAHLNRANYLATTVNIKAAKPDLDAAYAIAPDDFDVLMMVGTFAITEAEYERAQQLLDQALEKFPKRPDIYLRLAQLASAQTDNKLAIEQLERGIKECNPNVRDLLLSMVTLQFQAGDFEAAKKTCVRMRDSKVPPELVRFHEARLMLAAYDYYGAALEFEAVRPALARASNTLVTQQIDVFLGQCYEAMGQPDRQLETYRRLLAAAPLIVQARLGQAGALQALGRFDEAANDLEVLMARAEDYPQLHGPLLQLLSTNEQRKPLAKRDWNAVNKIAASVLAGATRSDADNDLLRAQVLMIQGRIDEAQTVLNALRRATPNDPRVWSALVKLLYAKQLSDRVGELLDAAQKQLGDNVTIMAERMAFVATQGGEDLPQKLTEMEGAFSKFTPAEQAQLYSQLGSLYFQLRDYANVSRCWQQVLKHNPKNAAIRQSLFELQVANRQEADMKAALKDMREVPELAQSPLYKYCEAMMLLLPVQERSVTNRGGLSEPDAKTVAEARKLIDEALTMRSEWSPLWRVRGEIEQLEGSNDAAINAFKKSLAVNRNGQTAVTRRLVQLLYAMRRYDDANESLATLGELGAGDPIKKILQDTWRALGKVDEALESAKKDVDAEPRNPLNHLFYGQLLANSGRTEEAEKEFRAAVEVGPEMAQSWDMLVRHLVNRKANDAPDVVRQASKPLTNNPLALARLYQYVNDTAQAEHYYKQAVEQQPTSMVALQQLVDFYFASKQAQNAKPFIQKFMDRAAVGKDDASREQLAWSRRAMANVIAEPRDYKHVLEATKLIEQNARGGKLSVEDIQSLVDLLSARPELDSRSKAIRYLETLKSLRALTPREEFAMGQQYDRSGNWVRGKDMILSAVIRQSNNPEMLLALGQMLEQHQEYEDSMQWLAKAEDSLTQLMPQQAEAYRRIIKTVRARVLAKTGRAREAVQMLESMVPNPLDAADIGLLADVSRSLESMEQYEPAEKLLKQFVALDPRGVLAMAGYQGRHGDLEKAFAGFDEARKSQPVTQILPFALESLRLHPAKANKEHFRKMHDWAAQGLEVEADATQIKLLTAEIYDLEGRTEEVLKTYRSLLADKSASDVQRAVVKNNLAYQLALAGGAENAREALKLIDEAIAYIGPTSDLLDTRGLVYLTQGENQRALEDLGAAAGDGPTTAKYIHLAAAQVKASDLTSARQTFEKAKKLSTDVNQLTSTDRKSYNELVEKLQ